MALKNADVTVTAVAGGKYSIVIKRDGANLPAIVLPSKATAQTFLSARNLTNAVPDPLP